MDNADTLMLPRAGHPEMRWTMPIPWSEADTLMLPRAGPPEMDNADTLAAVQNWSPRKLDKPIPVLRTGLTQMARPVFLPLLLLLLFRTGRSEMDKPIPVLLLKTGLLQMSQTILFIIVVLLLLLLRTGHRQMDEPIPLLLVLRTGRMRMAPGHDTG